MISLIDSDILIYECGFATEDKTEQEAFARMDERIDAILLATDADSYQCYISDSAENNFRYKIDPSYKANRTQPKPTHYEVLKEYLIVEHRAKVAHGMEADDALGITQTQTPPILDKLSNGLAWENPSTIICTIDKDLKQVAGLHYSWPVNRGGIEVRPAKIFEVSEREGLKYFYKQLLIGDTADNIKGVDGIGPKKADKLIDPCFTEEEMFKVVLSEYDDIERMNKNAQLLWILREEDGFIELSTKTAGIRKTKQT